MDSVMSKLRQLHQRLNDWLGSIYGNIKREIIEHDETEWHKWALAEVERLMDLNPTACSDDERRLEELAKRVEKYEEKHFLLELQDHSQNGKWT